MRIFSPSQTTIVARILLLLATALVINFVYSPGLTGGLFYDDVSNLAALTKIQGQQDAAEFVFSGKAGPLGRPIAFASFLPHASGWPENSHLAIQANVVVHICNAGLLLILAFYILKLRGRTTSQQSFNIAFAAASLWAVLPILASTNLIAVQRMTSLAALFGLAGLVAFVLGYRLQQSRPHIALLIQGLGLGLGTLLGIFTKESAALIPVFALIIDSTALRDLPGPRLHRLLRRSVLWLSLLIILYYLSPFARDWFATDVFRGVSPAERLFTQAVILWKYLYLTFVPIPTAFGPFHDHIHALESWRPSALALIAFGIMFAGAILARKVTIWPLFAVLWFFAGHLIESTTVTLELYFEHRNYLAVYGFCLMLAYAAWHAHGSSGRIAPALFFTYVGILMAVLLSLTLLWGDRHVAAETWAENFPGSSRAALHLARLNHDVFLRASDPAGNQASTPAAAAFVNKSLDRTAAACPECISVRLQSLLFACTMESDQRIEERFEQLRVVAKQGRAQVNTPDGLFPLRDLVLAKSCGQLTDSHLIDLIGDLLDNSNLQYPSMQVRFLFVRAAIAQDQGDVSALRSFLALAERVAPNALPVLEFQVFSFVENGMYDEAVEAIERRRKVSSQGGRIAMSVDRLGELLEFTEVARTDVGDGASEVEPPGFGSE